MMKMSMWEIIQQETMAGRAGNTSLFDRRFGLEGLKSLRHALENTSIDDIKLTVEKTLGHFPGPDSDIWKNRGKLQLNPYNEAMHYIGVIRGFLENSSLQETQYPDQNVTPSKDQITEASLHVRRWVRRWGELFYADVSEASATLKEKELALLEAYNKSVVELQIMRQNQTSKSHMETISKRREKSVFMMDFERNRGYYKVRDAIENFRRSNLTVIELVNQAMAQRSQLEECLKKLLSTSTLTTVARKNLEASVEGIRVALIEYRPLLRPEKCKHIMTAHQEIFKPSSPQAPKLLPDSRKPLVCTH